MSWISDSTELIAGAWQSSSYRGHGITGSVLRATTGGGTHGDGIFYNDWQSSADDTKEFRALLVTPPSAGTLTLFEDGSYAFVGPDGVYTFTYRLFVDGVDLGLATATITVGDPAGIVTGAGGIPSGESFGVPVVAGSVTVATVTGAGGIPSGESFGVPVVSSGSSGVVASAGGIPSGESFGVPTVTGSVDSGGGTGASAAAVWGYGLSNGLTAEQTLANLLQLAKDLHRIHGLESGSPMTVTQTSRSVAGITQSIAESAGSVTVTRTG